MEAFSFDNVIKELVNNQLLSLFETKYAKELILLKELLTNEDIYKLVGNIEIDKIIKEKGLENIFDMNTENKIKEKIEKKNAKEVIMSKAHKIETKVYSKGEVKISRI